jgi:hypothetical protein
MEVVLQIAFGILLAGVLKFIISVLFKATIKTLQESNKTSKSDIVNTLKDRV